MITADDVTNAVAAPRTGKVPKTFDTNPPAKMRGVGSGSAGETRIEGGGAGVTAPAATDKVTVPSSDDYLTRLVKYIPPEILGFYLFMTSQIEGHVTGASRSAWLGVILVVALIVTALYCWYVLKIVRWQQIAMSVVAIAVYVFSVGGWFATRSWYQAWYGGFALAGFAILVSIVPLPPLPVVQATPTGA